MLNLASHHHPPLPCSLSVGLLITFKWLWLSSPPHTHTQTKSVLGLRNCPFFSLTRVYINGKWFYLYFWKIQTIRARKVKFLFWGRSCFSFFGFYFIGKRKFLKSFPKYLDNRNSKEGEVSKISKVNDKIKLKFKKTSWNILFHGLQHIIQKVESLFFLLPPLTLLVGTSLW